MIVHLLQASVVWVAVKDIKSTAAIYVIGGYACSETIFDPIQNVNICWLTKEGMPIVELLEPVNDDSPVNKTLEKNGVTPYHTCYEVENIDLAIKKITFTKICSSIKTGKSCCY